MSKIEEIIDQADKQMDYSSYKKAMKLYEKALHQLPTPKKDQPFYLEIMTAIGDVLISTGKNREAKKHFNKILNHPDASTNALIHLRVGQIAVHNNEMEVAKVELKKALEIGGEDIFDSEYEEFYEIAKS